MKIGTTEDSVPRYTFPTCVGRPTLRGQTLQKTQPDIHLKDTVIGNDVEKHRALLDLTYPISHGQITQWDQMKQIWNHCVQVLGGDPTNQNVLITEAARNSTEHREKLYGAMFEMGFQGAYVAVQALLTLYSAGMDSGLILDSGDGVTHVIPVYQNMILKPQIQRINIAGRDITQYLGKLLQHRGYAFNTSVDFEYLKELKEKFCYIALDADKEGKLADETTVLNQSYTLPDGRKVTVARERFMAPELLFKPELNGFECPTIAQAVYDAIEQSPIDTRKTLMKGIIMSGCTTLFPGLHTRLKEELITLMVNEKLLKLDYAGNPTQNVSQEEISAYREKMKKQIRVDDPPNRKYSVF